MARNDQSGVDVDREIEQAWARFEEKLASRLRRLGDGRSMLVQTRGEEADEGARPYVQVMSFADGSARRCEVSSDSLLVPEARVGAAGEALFAALGFTPPSTDPEDDAPNWHLHIDADDCDSLAHTIVQVLREGFGVVHPLLLAGMPAPPDGADAHTASSDPTDVAPVQSFEPVEPDVAYAVTCEDELADLVDRTLATVMDERPKRDADGDWPVRYERCTAWVRILPGEPTIRIFALLVHDIRSMRSAHREVSILNRDATFIRYFLDEDLLVAELDLDAGPFVPRHLTDALARFHRATGRSVTDFAARTGGRA
jgi:hypothetical protein